MQETTKKKKKIVVGRRKTATAKVKLIDGDGKITVNKRKFEEYFPRPVHQIFVKKPLELLGLTAKMDVFALLKGGGITGQAEALKLGIARALIQHNPDYRSLLAQNGLLTRDPRMVERKKYGRAGARKRFQFSKR
ncbi:MAG: 30S ribosomal protein S9 [Candidatus Firestonebacteria bacterium RIFOXYA2_FULL_40_8]|nr:MAG: 30S ribosomal protein S9 [Candidatus Firestonebacteria bacterium RIFOXYA2_FULL_40_8]